jgi:hypothetical protein
MTINEQYKKWQENILKKSLEKSKERKERFEFSSGIEVPRVALPVETGRGDPASTDESYL